MDDLLRDTAARAIRYLDGLAARGVAPAAAAVERLQDLGGPLPAGPTDPAAVVALLDEIASPATIVRLPIPRNRATLTPGRPPASTCTGGVGAWSSAAGPAPQ